MLYVIIGEYGTNSLKARQSAREAHVARLKLLKDNGRLVLAGPCPAIDSVDPGPAGFTGSVIVAEFPSQEDALEWAESDPYITSGVYRNVTVKPFRQVFP